VRCILKSKELDFKFSFKNLLIVSILVCGLLRMNLVYSRFFESEKDIYQDFIYVKPKKWEIVLERKRVKDGY